MQICPKNARIIAWTVISVCLATSCAIMLSRIRAYEREGTLLDIQTEIDAAEGARRRYQATIDTVRDGAQRAGVQNRKVVVSVARPLEQARDEALLQSLQAQVNYRMASFEASDVEILTNFTSRSDATNVMMRLFRAGIETQIRGSGPKDGNGESFHLLVRKSDASKAREALPGVLAAVRGTNSEK